MAKYTEKQRELDELTNVEVPKNSKEIEFALSLGDLRENAEFKAAKERQGILNTTITKLHNDIDRAQIFDPSKINTTSISFGTVVTLHNTIKDKDEVFTILGPWESDPNNNIISYASPFGAAIMSKRKGEQFKFTVEYTVSDIQAAVF
ncbi:MAG: hypothetical protein Ta2G_18970 [Termitinemataceae bacterium]|nr:MAG: hypothetical protein Ta2G_18970 [Termitinemataceae bacterium]